MPRAPHGEALPPRAVIRLASRTSIEQILFVTFQLKEDCEYCAPTRTSIAVETNTAIATHGSAAKSATPRVGIAASRQQHRPAIPTTPTRNHDYDEGDEWTTDPTQSTNRIQCDEPPRGLPHHRNRR